MNLSDMTLPSAFAEVIGELAGAFDDRDMSSWFNHPNAWLNEAAPADVIARDLPAVLQAARADRFIARG